MTGPATRILATVAAGLLLTGCGGGDTKPGAVAHYSSVEQLAADLGCADLKNDGGQDGATVGGSCTDKDGDEIGFSLFETNVTRDSVITLGVPNGGHYVYGDRFLVDCTSSAEMNRVAKLLPGSATQD